MLDRNSQEPQACDLCCLPYWEETDDWDVLDWEETDDWDVLDWEETDLVCLLYWEGTDLWDRPQWVQTVCLVLRWLVQCLGLRTHSAVVNMYLKRPN